MTKLRLTRTEFPIVNSLDNLEVGVIYTTKNPKIFKHLKFNRGKEAGYVPERVNAIKKMIEAGIFRFLVVHVLLNLKGQVIDGNNRLKALADLGLPINFIITAEPAFNLPNESEVLNNVSDYNAINSSWTDKDAYLSALAYDEPTAKAIEKLKIWIENEKGMRSTLFTPSRLIALALRQTKNLSSAKQTRRAYCSEETAETLLSDNFKKLLEFLIEVATFTSEYNNSIESWFMVRGFMPTIWNKGRDYDVVLRDLKAKGFENYEKKYTTKAKGVETYCLEVLRMSNV